MTRKTETCFICKKCLTAQRDSDMRAAGVRSVANTAKFLDVCALEPGKSEKPRATRSFGQFDCDKHGSSWVLPGTEDPCLDPEGLQEPGAPGASGASGGVSDEPRLISPKGRKKGV